MKRIMMSTAISNSHSFAVAGSCAGRNHLSLPPRNLTVQAAGRRPGGVPHEGAENLTTAAPARQVRAR